MLQIFGLLTGFFDRQICGKIAGGKCYFQYKNYFEMLVA